MTVRSSNLRFALPMTLAVLACTPAAADELRPAELPADSANPRAIASFVAEASLRFGVPQRWIEAVMRVESEGNTSAISRAGAIGLMQIMPETYAMLRARLGLGANPYNPRDNIMAGAAYLREMHDRYGPTGFLAAYNAGPARWEGYLAGVRPLPNETVGYTIRLGRMLNANAPKSPNAAFTRAVATPEAAPIFVHLSDGSRVTGLQALTPNQREAAAPEWQPGRQPIASGNALSMQPNANSSAIQSSSQRTGDDRRKTRAAANLSSPPPTSALFVLRIADRVDP